MARTSLYALLILTLIASVFGTIQLVGWMPHPAHEWSGAIGAFIATIFSSLLGTAGSFLVIFSGLLISGIYATNSDLRRTVDVVKKYLAKLNEHVQDSRTAVSARLGELADTRSADRSDSRGTTIRRPEAEPETAADNEPAQMMRRMRGADEPAHISPRQAPTARVQQRRAEEIDDRPATSRAIPFPEPRVTRSAPTASPAPIAREREPEPEPPLTFRATPPPPSPTARRDEIPVDDDDLMLTSAAKLAKRLEEEQHAREEGEDLDDVIPPSQGTRAGMPVKIVHGEPQMPPASSSNMGRLILNVQEGETDADLETDDEGELIEKLRDEQIVYMPPPIELLLPQVEQEDVNDEELKENGRILQEKLATFNIQIEDLVVTPGPVVTLYEFVPAAGIKIAQIESLTDDIALALKARGIRIIAPIPGKGTVGVEIPNHKPAMVRIRSVLNTAKFREANVRLPLALGKTTVGEVFCDDLAKAPHLLIAGATGSGKSVGINAILASLLYRMHPRDLKFVIIDPKKIELSQYKALRDHFIARCPDIDEEIITQPQNAVLALKSLEMEMDRRYDILAKVGQRNIFDYNQKIEEGKYRDVTDFHHVKLPYIVLILDELADLMITAAKEVEEPIARLAQLARAIGIHLIVATQRPSVDVITGVIKANFPARIAYQVASKIDSRTILDMNGAEQLLGNGDMLYLPGGQPKPLRLQNAFISTEEVELLCEHIGKQTGYTRPYMLPSVAEKNRKGGGGVSDERDELFDEAAHLVVRHQQGSVSLLQRRLKVGYSRAARIVDELEMAGIVGPFDGSKARAVLLESEAELEAYL
jgi:DNA segregation ATPase FtsK/SpoIIIE-like protein